MQAPWFPTASWQEVLFFIRTANACKLPEAKFLRMPDGRSMMGRLKEADEVTLMHLLGETLNPKP